MPGAHPSGAPTAHLEAHGGPPRARRAAGEHDGLSVRRDSVPPPGTEVLASAPTWRTPCSVTETTYKGH